MNEKGGEIVDIHALLFEMMNEQQNQTEDNVNETDNKAKKYSALNQHSMTWTGQGRKGKTEPCRTRRSRTI